MDIKYKIEFYSNWHCGSGLAAGADVDLLVVKDRDKLPYVPGKTMKGLVREMMELQIAFCDNIDIEKAFQRSFGYFKDKDDKITGSVFFSNAEIAEGDRRIIVSEELGKYLYDSVSSTAIVHETGVAKDHSLRKMEIVVPCCLYGKITGVDETICIMVENSLRMIKHMGMHRHRGLGRCKITIEKGGKE